MESTNIFKTCPCCEKIWETRDDFIADLSLVLNGYQVSFKSLDTGLLLFTHLIDECKSTMGIYVSEFDDLYDGERYSVNKALSPECPRYCIDERRLDRCNAHCECAYVREIVNIVANLKNSKGVVCNGSVSEGKLHSD